MRALVTGAGSGIGRATCLRLARDGKAQGTPAKIAAVDVASSPGLDGVVKQLIALGAEAIAPHGDMATADAAGEVVAAAGAPSPPPCTGRWRGPRRRARLLRPPWSGSAGWTASSATRASIVRGRSP